MMRRAMRYDPEAIHEVPRGGDLEREIERLLNEWHAKSNANLDDPDAMFMLAALQFILGDPGRAYFAIDRAIDMGDADDSAMKLRRLIREAMEKAGAKNAPSEPAPAGQPAEAPASVVPESRSWQVPY